ncbi:MAG: hypothetical protein ACQEXJ_15450 [Myxococcota bacterium]
MDTPPETMPGLRGLCRRVRWRLKLQRAVSRGIAVGAVTLAGFALAVLAVKLRLLAPDTLQPAAWAAGALAGLAVLTGLLRRVDDLEAAALMDRSGGLYDRLGSAVAFLREDAGDDPLKHAAIRDAERHLDQANPKAAAPWPLPPHLGWLAGTAAVVAGLAFLQLPVGWTEGRPLHPLEFEDLREPTRPPLTDYDKERLEEEREELEQAANDTQDPEVKRWIEELNDLLRAIQEGRISPEEAHARLAKLDQARQSWEERVAEDLEQILEEAKQAAENVKYAHQDVDPLLEAIRKKQWDKAAEAMEKLAEKTEKGELKRKRDRRRVAKNLEDLADRLKTERQKRQDHLKKERDRLKKKQDEEKDRLSKRDRDRLKDKERQLERLRREQQEMSEARRQLERLQRQMEQTAEDMMRRAGEQQQPMTAEQMRRAKDMLRRMQEVAQGKRQMRVAEGRIIDTKEMLRRGGEKDGKGQKGGDGKGGDGKERFLVRAEGGQEGRGDDKGDKQGEQVTMLNKGGEGSEGGLVMPGEGRGGQPIPTPGRGAGPGEGSEVGDGAGEGHDPNVLGEKTQNEVETVDSQVRGQEGAGPTQSRVIFSAASKGFTSQSWKQVHQDYTGVVEEQLDRQEVPAGERRYVRRYFDLIRPR